LAIKKEEKTSGLKMDDFLKDFCSKNCSFASRQINRSLSDWKRHWESDVHKIKYEDAYPEPRQDFRVDDHNNENVDIAYNVTENENFFPFKNFTAVWSSKNHIDRESFRELCKIIKHELFNPDDITNVDSTWNVDNISKDEYATTNGYASNTIEQIVKQTLLNPALGSLLCYPILDCNEKQDWNSGEKFKHNKLFQTKSALLLNGDILFIGETPVIVQKYADMCDLCTDIFHAER
jgi:hypothetical protein